MLGKLHDEVLVGIAKASLDPDGPFHGVISLSFQKEDPPFPDNEEAAENYETVFLTVATAKGLLVDLRDAVDAVVEGKETF